MADSQYKPLPPWSEMPEWAKYRAVDSNGELCVFTDKPTKEDGYFIPEAWQSYHAVFGNGYDPTNWQDSLECRPEQQEGPVLVPEVYTIEGTDITVAKDGDDWYAHSDSKGYLSTEHSWTKSFALAQFFDSPTAAAAYWQAVKNMEQ